jgi:putative ABC transport system ATP-binding protein
MAVGLDYNVGVGGRRLTNIQRQKLAIARALLKQPDLLIINEAAAVMDGATQLRLGKRILESRRGRGVVWTLQRATWAKYFDCVLVMKAGRQVGQGTFEDLNKPGSALGELVAAE